MPKNTKPSKSTADIYAEVNAKILAKLAEGVAPWQKPWVGELSAPRNLQSGKPYRGINALLLGLSGYGDPRWTTFNGARKMEGKVRKGEKSTLVTLWKRIKVKDATATNGEKIIAILRYFRVFNVEQVEWAKPIKPLAVAEPAGNWSEDQAGEDALTAYIDSDPELSIGYGGGSAHYAPKPAHHIQLPVREDFRTAGGFYGVAFHEGAHSTGPELGRKFGSSFGDRKYSQEELVAEMGSAFVLAALGIEGEFDNTAAYIKGWSKAIEEDDKLLVRAAGQAQKAADRILGISWETPGVEDNTKETVAA